MPVVPEVDVDGTSATDKEEQEIDAEADGDYERADESIVGHGGSGWPTHVEDLEFETIDLGNLREGGAKAASEEGGDDAEADETDADVETALESLREIDADADAEDGEDDRHHHGGAEADDIRENSFHM